MDSCFTYFIENTWMGNLGDITNNDNRLYYVTDINKFVQESSDSMSATKNGNFM